MSHIAPFHAGSPGKIAGTPVSFIRRHAGLLVGTGIALAAMATFVQVRARQAEEGNPPRGNFIEVDGIRLHYVERGSGPAVVLLHGNGAMIEELNISGLPSMAAREYRVIAFDRPGYGYSERPRGSSWGPVEQAHLLQRALQRLGVENPVVVGHSWGALVALALGLEYPQYVRSLLLLSGYYYPTLRVDVALFSMPALPLIGDLMRYTISPLLGRLIWPAMVRKLFYPAPTTARFKNEYPVWMGLRPSQLRASAQETALMIPAAHRLSSRYAELTMPVTIMAGAGDVQVFPRLHSERLHKELPQSELILIPGEGHMIQHTVPRQVLSAIERMTNATVPAMQVAQAAVAAPAAAL